MKNIIELFKYKFIKTNKIHDKLNELLLLSSFLYIIPHKYNFRYKKYWIPDNRTTYKRINRMINEIIERSKSDWNKFLMLNNYMITLIDISVFSELLICNDKINYILINNKMSNNTIYDLLRDREFTSESVKVMDLEKYIMIDEYRKSIKIPSQDDFYKVFEDINK